MEMKWSLNSTKNGNLVIAPAISEQVSELFGYPVEIISAGLDKVVFQREDGQLKKVSLERLVAEMGRGGQISVIDATIEDDDCLCLECEPDEDDSYFEREDFSGFQVENA